MESLSDFLLVLSICSSIFTDEDTDRSGMCVVCGVRGIDCGICGGVIGVVRDAFGLINLLEGDGDIAVLEGVVDFLSVKLRGLGSWKGEGVFLPFLRGLSNPSRDL